MDERVMSSAEELNSFLKKSGGSLLVGTTPSTRNDKPSLPTESSTPSPPPPPPSYNIIASTTLSTSHGFSSFYALQEYSFLHKWTRRILALQAFIFSAVVDITSISVTENSFTQSGVVCDTSRKNSNQVLELFCAAHFTHHTCHIYQNNPNSVIFKEHYLPFCSIPLVGYTKAYSHFISPVGYTIAYSVSARLIFDLFHQSPFSLLVYLISPASLTWSLFSCLVSL